MHRFTESYLDATRRGMWSDRSPLAALELPRHDRILDVGCGTGEFTSVLREESAAEVVGVDADPHLLTGSTQFRSVIGDAYTLPVTRDSFGLVACQALLVNLRNPTAAIAEFVRAARHRIAAVEPDNSAVTVESTVPQEAEIDARARRAYIHGIDTDVTLGSDLADRFRDLGLREVTATTYEHTKTVRPPYSTRALRSAANKARGDRLEDQSPVLRNAPLSETEYDSLKSDWETMGRTILEQMRDQEYERTETIPFHVTTATIPDPPRSGA